ncbi:MAG: trehalose operon repressor [Ethanoligenens sp.]|uniref:trehalose operon repressor n=1 Tax=Ethanoligenens sp. TaxID=2099655 RepID=UPI0039EA13F5
MPSITTKYNKIYQDLKSKIEDKTYEAQELLPSEAILTSYYDCSRNTVRRAIANLALEGYVQSLHGKGVRVIYQPHAQSAYAFGNVESFHEASIRNGKIAKTEVPLFVELVVDQHIAKRTSFPVGIEIYYIQRIRCMEQKALIIDHNYFRKDVVPGLTKEIAKGSIYNFIENKLHVHIVTTKRVMTVEHVNQLDRKYLELGDYNCVAVVSNYTYNADGIMFEYTQSRHRPDYFAFYDQARRNSPEE